MTELSPSHLVYSNNGSAGDCGRDIFSSLHHDVVFRYAVVVFAAVC